MFRGKNEDNFYIDEHWKYSDTEEYHVEGTISHENAVVAVCDGMGGQAAGEVASLIAVGKLAEYDRDVKKTLQHNISKYVEEANARICKVAREMKASMGTTVAILECFEEQMVAFNVGDSRIYRYRDGYLERVSTDHTMVARMIQMGVITEGEAEKHPMAHRITQYLGIEPQEMTLEPAIHELGKMKKSDRLLICSDGLTDMLSEKEIANIFAQEKNVKETAQLFLQAALEAGGTDNITVVLLEKE